VVVLVVTVVMILVVVLVDHMVEQVMLVLLAMMLFPELVQVVVDQVTPLEVVERVDQDWFLSHTQHNPLNTFIKA
tara:strand:- start:33 stop:257 length:225 start_codon:yes stop_codon:yes gene_type:complete